MSAHRTKFLHTVVQKKNEGYSEVSIALLRRSDEITLKRYALRISLVEQLDFARHTQSAKQTESRECYDTIDDCEYYFCNGKCVSKCPIGQKLDASGYCVKEWCYDNFLCPANYRVTISTTAPASTDTTSTATTSWLSDL